MTHLVSARLSEQTAERVKQYARKRQRSVNETVSLALEEWLRQNEFAFIEFRDTRDGRVAYMKNSRLPVYWIVKVAKSLDMDVDKVCAYWPNRPRAWVKAALHYYEVYTEEIDQKILEEEAVSFETVKRQLPQVETFALPEEISAEATE